MKKLSRSSNNDSILWLIIILSLNLIILQVNSTSQRNPSLNSRAISHPSSIQFKIIPNKNSHQLISTQNNKRSNTNSIPIPITTIEREPNYNDSFLLSFQSHSKPFTLSLRPSMNLIHPNGIKSYDTIIDESGNRIIKESRITREEIKVYEGWVLREGDDLDKWTREEMAGVHRGDGNGRGWVRLVLNPSTTNMEREEVKFQGAFETDEGYFTIFNTDNYLRSKEVLDPEPPMLLRKRSGEEEDSWSQPNMIIIRERDVLSPQDQVKEMRKRGLAVPSWQEAESTTSSSTTSCGHDQLEFNTDPLNPIYDNSFSYLESTSSSDSLFSPSLWGKSLLKYPPTTPFSHQHSKNVDKRQGDIGGGTNLSSNFINSIGSTAGCPKSPMLVYLGIAADCTYVAHYQTADLARIQILTDINSASALYSSSFNLSLGIIELNVQSTPCPTSQSAVDPLNPWNVGCSEGGSPGLNLNDRLSVFSKWRGAKGGDGAGLWHLFTNCSTGSEVGVAWLGQLCKVTSGTSSGQSTSGTGVTAISRSEWQVFAHETGHSIGSIHDCTTGCTLTNSNPICCPLSTTSCDAGANFIMSPVSSKNVTAFSPCSIGNICYALGNSLNTSCLVAPGSLSTTSPTIISLKSCGNGILEAGEDCDPGNNEDPCCDAKTCKFAPGAVCDPHNSLCCTSTCQLARAGTVCRPSVDSQCDTAEMCTGQSSTCPKDVFASDGKSCGADELACATGVCTSRALQCQTAGISLGLNAACPIRASSSCQVTCADPSSSADCIVLEQNFRDGSPCGYAGTCENSVCNAGAPIQVALSWYRQNLQISIPVTIAIGLLILLSIYSLCKCGIQRSRRRQMAASSKYGIPMVPIRTPGEGEPGVGFRSKYMKRTRINPQGFAPDLSQPPPVRRGDRRSDRFNNNNNNNNGSNGYNNNNNGTPMIPNPSQNSAGGGVGSGFRFNRNGNSDPNANIHGGRDWVDPVAYNGYQNRG